MLTREDRENHILSVLFAPRVGRDQGNILEDGQFINRLYLFALLDVRSRLARLTRVFPYFPNGAWKESKLPLLSCFVLGG